MEGGGTVAGVVLAAGSSTRLEDGQKLLLPHRGRALVSHPVAAALEAGLDPVVVVLGHRADEVAGALEAARASLPRRGRRMVMVRNRRHAEGQATSLARGLLEVRTATDAEAAAVLLGDEPGIRVEAVRAVVEAWRRRGEERVDVAARARYRDRPGHPVVIPRRLFPEVEGLRGDRGARGLLRDDGRCREVELSWRGPRDVDTRADYEALTREEGPRDAGGDAP